MRDQHILIPVTVVAVIHDMWVSIDGMEWDEELDGNGQ
jgi:hypothetical protein